ncbi:MAG TPA: histidine phosphatase family protein [Candidatus Cybelea sp.]|nr:histidine phosphatase family protein [Candidatus Cybelea sp.]
MTESIQRRDSAEGGPLRLYTIRHGETEWSLSGRHTGRTDLALTEQGEDEARQLEPYLHGIRFSSVLASPRQRARRTCALAGLGQQAAIDPELAEWDYGDYEGERSVDIRKTRPDWNIFRDGCPNGESPVAISDRADRVIARLRSLTGNIALFSHGHFGLVLAARWIGLPVAQGQHFSLSTGSLGVLSNDPRHPDVPVVALWNFTPRRHALQG